MNLLVLFEKVTILDSLNMAMEGFKTTSTGTVHEGLVVKRLRGRVSGNGMPSRNVYGLKGCKVMASMECIWFGNVLDHDGYMIVPRLAGFAVQGCSKVAVFVKKVIMFMGPGVGRIPG